MNSFKNKKILLIICGGIAAYKSLELIRSLKKRGVHIKTILTKSATEFVTKLSVSSLSEEKVYTDLFDHELESEMSHIKLSRWADLILICPATANTISKLSKGTADDLASTVVIASNKQIFIAPAMNVRMWEHTSNKENVSKLKQYGYKFIGPEIGDMACGEYGDGKMVEPDKIILFLEKYISNQNSNKKFKALVTAGPTIEPVDPVRFITNHSSGKQGYEIAKSFSDNGFDTTLISGPTYLESPENLKTVRVKTADEMYDETIKRLPVDVAVFTAAVSDYKVKNYSKEKIKKNEDLTLKLELNKDILEYVSKNNYLRPKIVVGFAAETNDINLNAKYKLNKKNCDLMILNDVSKKETGFGSDFNEVTIFYNNGKDEKLKKMHKSNIANEIVERLISKLN